MIYTGRPWIFGQHRDIVLPAVCHLLDNVAERFLKPNERGDPVRVARALSAVVSQVHIFFIFLMHILIKTMARIFVKPIKLHMKYI